MKKIFFEKQNVIKNIKKSGTPLVLFAPLWAFYQIEGPQMNSSHKLKGEKMQKRFFEKQQLIKNIKKFVLYMVIFSSLVDFYPMSGKQKKLKKVSTIFRFFDLFCM